MGQEPGGNGAMSSPPQPPWWVMSRVRPLWSWWRIADASCCPGNTDACSLDPALPPPDSQGCGALTGSTDACSRQPPGLQPQLPACPLCAKVGQLWGAASTPMGLAAAGLWFGLLRGSTVQGKGWAGRLGSIPRGAQDSWVPLWALGGERWSVAGQKLGVWPPRLYF